MAATPFSIAALVAAGCLAGVPADPSGQARIGLDRGEVYVVQALFDGASDDALHYRLDVVREGRSGRSSSSQGGAFRSVAGQTDTLSSVRVSAAPGDTFRATLVVTRGETTVSETSVEETVR